MSWLNRHPGPPSPAVEALPSRTGCLLVGGGTFRGDDPNAGTDSEGAFEPSDSGEVRLEPLPDTGELWFRVVR